MPAYDTSDLPDGGDFGLRAIVDAAADEFLRAPDEASAARPGPGRWCAREIVGHLIDSAATNHGRFVRAQLSVPSAIVPYAQDEWVRVQAYGDAPWPELVALWRAYNHHLARVIAAVPDEIRHRPLGAGPDHPPTLHALMADYVAHLLHHLPQARAALASARWALWRQDDNGNRVQIDTYATWEEADGAQRAFEARGHKQIYWVSAA